MLRVLAMTIIIGLIAASCLPGSDSGDDPTQTPIIITPTPRPETPTEEEAELEPTATTAPTATLQPSPTSEPTATATTPPEPTATATTAATATIAPPATATEPPPAAGDIEILQLGFGQAGPGEEVGWSFIIQNTNTELAVENMEFRVTLFDDADAIVESEERTAPLIFPDERTGFAGLIFVDEGVSIASMEVQIAPGGTTTVEVADGFPVDTVTFYPDENFPSATGLVNNLTDSLVTDLRISAVTFDADGQINGGGFTFLAAAGPASQTGVSVSVTSGSDVADVELFAGVSFLSDAITPDPATDPVVTKFGFGQPEDDNILGWGALLENPNATEVVRDAEIVVWFQDAEGRVLESGSNFLEVVPPGQTIGVADGFVFLPDGTTATTMSALVVPGTLEPTDITAWFTADSVAYVDDPFFPEVTGNVNNPFAQDLEDLWATAIAYDEAGNIIGGGFTFIELAPANAPSEVSIAVTVSSVPARVEIYAYPSSLTDF